MKELFGIMIFVITGFLLCVLVVGIPSYFIARHSCFRAGQEMNLECKFSFWTECLVKNANGQWIKLSNYQSVNLEK